MATVGDYVEIPWTDYGISFNNPPKKYTLTGTIIEISGGYHYIKVDNNPKYKILELYESEFEVV